MYDAVQDAYCYPGTAVLRNLRSIKEQRLLDEFEALVTAERADEPLPEGILDSAHYKALHQHLFQDIYEWAGEFRTVRIGKNGSAFCYPEHISEQMDVLFEGLRYKKHLTNLSKDEFSKEAAEFLAALNAIHPFREGNGRTQNVFLILLAAHAGHRLDLSLLQPTTFLEAMIASFQGDTAPLARELRRLIV